MDWMGGRLSQLIEEGKRALGKEVVVMSESHEDEVDDGMGAWVEDDEEHLSASRSLRRVKSRSRNSLPNFSPPLYSSPQSSPRKDRFTVPAAPRNRGLSIDSDSPSFTLSAQPEDESSWQTPELRESMERARALYRQQHRM